MKIISILTLLVAPTTNAFSPISSSSSASASMIHHPTRTISTTRRSTTNLYSSSTTTPTITLTEGLGKTILKQGNPNLPLKFGDIATVSYNVYIPSTQTTISKSNKQKVVIGESIMIEGWEIGLSSMKVGEKSIIHIIDSDKFGYGKDGIPPILGSSEKLDIDIEVLDCEEQSRFGTGVGGAVGGDVSAISGMTGSGELGALDPMKPVSSYYTNIILYIII